MIYSENLSEESQTYIDAVSVFQRIFKTQKKPKLARYETFTIDDFELLGIKNHRANKSHKKPEDAYPVNNRPRGQNDIDSVNYAIQTTEQIDPIALFKTKNKTFLLDGAHRIVAAYLTGSNIHAAIFTF